MARVHGNRIAVVQDTAQEKEGEIYIPQDAQQKPQTGTIVSIGSCEGEGLKVNDRVYFAQLAGTEIQIDEETKWILLHPDDILLVL